MIYQNTVLLFPSRQVHLVNTKMITLHMTDEDGGNENDGFFSFHAYR